MVLRSGFANGQASIARRGTNIRNYISRHNRDVGGPEGILSADKQPSRTAQLAPVVRGQTPDDHAGESSFVRGQNGPAAVLLRFCPRTNAAIKIAPLASAPFFVFELVVSRFLLAHMKHAAAGPAPHVAKKEPSGFGRRARQCKEQRSGLGEVGR